MLCPECGSTTKVTDSRYRSKQYRRRLCKSCGHRFTTYEISQIDLLDIFDKYLPYKEVDKLSHILEKEFPDTLLELGRLERLEKSDKTE